jgi:hypothetical protein
LAGSDRHQVVKDTGQNARSGRMGQIFHSDQGLFSQLSPGTITPSSPTSPEPGQLSLILFWKCPWMSHTTEASYPREIFSVFFVARAFPMVLRETLYVDKFEIFELIEEPVPVCDLEINVPGLCGH